MAGSEKKKFRNAKSCSCRTLATLSSEILGTIRLPLTRTPSPCYARSVDQAGADVITLCHGDPIPMPDDAQDVKCFYGAAGMERQHTQIAIREQMEKFKAIRF